MSKLNDDILKLLKDSPDVDLDEVALEVFNNTNCSRKDRLYLLPGIRSYVGTVNGVRRNVGRADYEAAVQQTPRRSAAKYANLPSNLKPTHDPRDQREEFLAGSWYIKGKGSVRVRDLTRGDCAILEEGFQDRIKTFHERITFIHKIVDLLDAEGVDTLAQITDETKIDALMQ